MNVRLPSVRTAARQRAADARRALGAVAAPLIDKTSKGGYEVFGTNPTERELESLAEVFVHGDQQRAADCMGIARSTMKQALTNLYARLGAISGMEAAVSLGWLDFPHGLLKPHAVIPEPFHLAVARWT